MKIVTENLQHKASFFEKFKMNYNELESWAYRRQDNLQQTTYSGCTHVERSNNGMQKSPLGFVCPLCIVKDLHTTNSLRQIFEKTTWILQILEEILEIEVCCAYLARKTGSTPTVGSSRIRSCGFWSRAAPSETRRRWPPLNKVNKKGRNGRK